jgi:hypothetical protein
MRVTRKLSSLVACFDNVLRWLALFIKFPVPKRNIVEMLASEITINIKVLTYIGIIDGLLKHQARAEAQNFVLRVYHQKIRPTLRLVFFYDI